MKKSLPLKAVVTSYILLSLLIFPSLLKAQTSGFGGSEDPPIGGCSSSSEITEIFSNNIFPFDEQELWFFFTAPHDSVACLLGAVQENDFPNIVSATLYEGNDCNSLNILQTDTFQGNDSSYLPGLSLYYPAVEQGNKYYLKLERNSIEGEVEFPQYSIKAAIDIILAANCPGFISSPCNIIGNGGFELLTLDPPHANEPFEKNQVCYWKSGIPNPHIVKVGNNNCVALTTIYDEINSELKGVEAALFQTNFHPNNQYKFIPDQSYILSFEITKLSWSLYSDYFKVVLAKSSNSGIPKSNFDPPPSLTNKQLVATVQASQLNSHSLKKFTFIFEADDEYDQIYFYPENDETGWSYMLLDNVFLSEFANAGPDVHNNCEAAEIGPPCILPGATYSWSPSTGLSDPNIANPLANPLNSTEYTLTVSYNDGTTTHFKTDKVTVSKTGNYPTSDVIVDGVKNIEQVRQVNSTEITETGGQYTSNGYTFYIKDELIVNADFEMTDCNILLAENAKITVKDGAIFEFRGDIVSQDNFIKSCSGMWDGIIVTGIGSAVHIDHVHPFSNSMNGITSNDDGDLHLTNTDFDRNNRVMNVGPVNSFTNIYFQNNTVECSSPLISSNNLPYFPEHAIVFSTNNQEINNIGGPDPNQGNVFYGSGGNIQIEQYGGVNILYNEFYDFNTSIYGYYPPPSMDTYSHIGTAINVIGDTYDDTDIRNNRFLNCENSVKATGAARILAYDNFINILPNGNRTPVSGEQSAFITSTNNLLYHGKLEILRNIGVNMSAGVIASNFFSNDIRIKNNTFMTDLNATGTGIKINNYTSGQHWSGNPIIQNNTLINTRVGIELNNMNEVGARIVGNQIKNISYTNCGYPIPAGCLSTSYGIKASLGTYEIQENTIKYTNPISNYNAMGLVIASSDNYLVTCNYIENAGNAIRFENVNVPVSYNAFDKNEFHDSKAGLILSNAGEIGTVGVNGSGLQNEWTYNVVTPDYHTYAIYNTNGHLSTIYSSKSTPTINGNDVSSSFIQAFYTSNPTNTTCASSALMSGTSNGGSVSTMEKDSNGTSYSNYWQSYEFMNKNKFIADRDSFAYFELQRFYHKYSQDSLMQTDKKLTEIYDSLKLLSLGKAMDGALNFSTQNAHPFDVEFTTINKIYYQYIQMDSLSSKDSSIARELAASCPYYKGLAVYKARNLMMQLDEYYFVNACETGPVASNSTAKRLKELTEDKEKISVYPNPTMDNLHIEIPEGLEQVKMIIYNIQGTKVKEATLKSTNNIFPLSSLNSGMYFYQLFHEDKRLSSGKVQLLK